MNLRKILPIVLCFILITAFVPFSVFANDSINSITINFAAYNTDSGTFMYSPKELTVVNGTAASEGLYNVGPDHTVGGADHGVEEGEITVLDALVAAHLEKDGDISGINGTESYVMGIFGEYAAYGVGFTVNGHIAMGEVSDSYAINEYVLQDGDTVLFFTYSEAGMMGEYNSYFDRQKLEVNENEEFSLNIMGYQALELLWSNPGDPTGEYSTLQAVSDASVCIVNTETGELSETGATTDSNGDFTYSFDTAGSYLLSAKGTCAGAPIIAPLCFVTVTTEEKNYDVTVSAAPGDNVNVKFYQFDGYDDNGYDIIGDEITAVDKGVENGYHIYNMKLPEGRVSYRATDASGNSLGGMTFAVSADSENSVVLRRANIYTSTKIDGAYANSEQYITTVADSDDRFATAGDAYVDTRTKYPYLLPAYGNNELYTLSVIPSEEYQNTIYNLGMNVVANYTVPDGTTELSKAVALSTMINSVITAPSEASVKVFRQLKYFKTTEIEYSSCEVSGDIATYTYRLPKSNGSHTYRVSMDGKITKAGYINLSSEDKAKIDITFAENENPKIRPEYDLTTTIGKRLEDSILLNINEQNYLRMNIGEEFKARAYRAWEIINGDTSNVMIEPDFEYKIVSGDSVTLAKNGQSATLSAVKEGISIIEITYNAIEIGGNTKYTGLYGAIDPARTGMFIVNVGGNTDSKITLPEWDSDFDTVYFTEDMGEYNFAPVSDGEITVTCNGTEIFKNADGTFTLPISNGNNIVCATSGETEEYIIIKGKKVTVSIENATSPNEPIKQGDKVNISFKGLHMPVPKFSGYYNPGYLGTAKLKYTDKNGNEISGSGAQYDFINNHTISFNVYEAGIFTLSGGKATLNVTGAVPGEHRKITEAGKKANFSASTGSYEYSILPDLSFAVLKNENPEYSGQNVSCEGNKITASFISTADVTLDFILAAYSGDELKAVVWQSKSISAGENSVELDFSELNSYDDVRLYVWDKNMKPVFDEINVGE